MHIYYNSQVIMALIQREICAYFATIRCSDL